MKNQLKTASRASLVITKEISFYCPECNEEIILNTDTSLSTIAGIDIEEVLEELNNTGFYKFICPECGKEFLVDCFKEY